MRSDRLLTLYFVCPGAIVREWFDRHLAQGTCRNTNRILPVLMYHSISSDPEPGIHPYYKLCTPPGRFEEQMLWLQEAGYRGVTLQEGLAWLNAHTDEQGLNATRTRPVALTFDDGFHDFYTSGWPVLQKYGFTATIYLPTGLIAEKHCNAFQGLGLERRRRRLTWGETRELARSGIEIGSHTVTHPVLYELPWERVEAELRDSKLEIEDRLARSVFSFSHPYAFPQEDKSYVKRYVDLLTQLGYSNAVTTCVGRVRNADSLFTLRRVPVNGDDDKPLFLAKLSGYYDMVGPIQSFVRKFRRLVRVITKLPSGARNLARA